MVFKHICTIFIFWLLVSNVYAEVKVEVEKRGGIHLSFDDVHIDSWYDARYLFIKYNAKVTFFVSNFDSLSIEQIKKLQVLKRDGHEIASHSLHHKDMDGILTGGGFGEGSEVDRYIQEEINPSIKLMTQAGFSSINFAVPFSRRNSAYLNAVLQKFYFVRVGSWFPDEGDITKVKKAYYTCGDQINNRRLLESFGLNNEEKFPLYTIIQAMEHAHQTNSVVYPSPIFIPSLS